jgi:hypothetical protein
LRRARILRLTVRFDMAGQVTGAPAGAIKPLRRRLIE